MAQPKPVLNEISGRASNAAWNFYFDSSDLPSHILRSEGFAGSGFAGLFNLYDEMEEKDGHLFAVLQTRKNGVLSCPRKVVAVSDSRRDQEIARFIERALRRIAGFDQSLLNVLDALGKGLSIQEIVWEIRDGQVAVRELKSRAPGRFLFADDGALRLNVYATPGFSTPADAYADNAAAQTGLSRSLWGQALPDRKFIRFTFGGLYDNLYGRGLCARAYWYYWFKKNNLKFWVIYNEKFGSPTVIGKYRPGASEEDRRRLFEVIDSLQNDTGVTVPESVSLELLEAQRTGNASTYRELAEWCNDEISKIVLGATLTASEGRRSGSLALGQVHERVRGEYIEADARAVESVVNSQLVRWLVDFNFGVNVETPRWTIDTTRDDALERDMAVDRELVAAGIALPERYFYDKYQRPAPIGAEPALRYDDKNLFQYHLRYGVLTINEARARLGLPPVEWGNQRTLATNEPNPTPEPPVEAPDPHEESVGEEKIETGQEKEKPDQGQ